RSGAGRCLYVVTTSPQSQRLMMEWIQVLYEPQGHQTNSMSTAADDQDLMEVWDNDGTRYDGVSRDTSSLAHISAAREKLRKGACEGHTGNLLC
ncbi:hypothetical protein QQF64_024693, partial [Cirrhinus molitorella]